MHESVFLSAAPHLVAAVLVEDEQDTGHANDDANDNERVQQRTAKLFRVGRVWVVALVRCVAAPRERKRERERERERECVCVCVPSVGCRHTHRHTDARIALAQVRTQTACRWC